MASPATLKVFKNYINGEWVEPRSGKAIENRNPANTSELVGMFPASNEDDVKSPLTPPRPPTKMASHARSQARRDPLPRRRNPDRTQRRLPRDMTREMGKVLAETRGDVQEAIDMTYLMAGEGRRQFGQTTPSELPNKFAMSVRRPSASPD